MRTPDRYATRDHRTEFEIEPQVVPLSHVDDLYDSDPPPDYFDAMANATRRYAARILDNWPADGPRAVLGRDIDVEA